MKVLQLLHNLRAEGAQRVVVNLVANLPTAETKIIQQQVCAWKTGGPLASQIQVPVWTGGAPPLAQKSLLTRLWAVRALLKRQAIDLVHAHLSDAVLVAALLKLISGRPFIVTHHCPECWPPNLRGIKARVYRVLVSWAMHQASAHVAISASVQQSVSQQLNLQAARWQVITNGVPIPNRDQLLLEPLPAIAAELQKQAAPILLAVGRLDNVKDWQQLISAMPAVLVQLPQARLIIIGEGNLRIQLQNQITQLRLDQQVFLMGLSTQVDAWLQRATLLVSCSFYEGVPMAVLEGMAWGLPVVASDVAGNRDVITDQINGYLYTKTNTDNLAQALVYVLQNPAKAKMIGEAARSWVIQNYSQASMIKAYQQLYLSL